MPNQRKNLALSISVLAFLTSSFLITLSVYIKGAMEAGPDYQDEATTDTVSPLPYFEVGSNETPQESVEDYEASHHYTVEIASKNNEKAAQNQVKKLSLKGVDCFYTPLSENGKTVYKVRSGLYPSEDLAKKQAKFLLQEFALGSQITRL